MKIRYCVYRMSRMGQAYNNGEPIFSSEDFEHAKEYAKNASAQIRIADERIVVMEEKGYFADGCWWSQAYDQKLVSWAKS